jgi:type VI secretion system protein ImpM
MAADACAVRPAQGALPAPDLEVAQAAFDDYLAGACLADLEAGLAGRVQAKRLLLALGLLLSPLRRPGPAPSHCLALPLPQEASMRRALATFWMALAAPLLARQDLELAMFFARVAGQPALVLGLDGANPSSLSAIIDPDAAREEMVLLEDCGWVDGVMHGDAALQRLAACLEQRQMGLPTALQLFQETFC